MSIENFKNPWTNDWAKGEKNHPDWLGGEQALGGNKTNGIKLGAWKVTKHWNENMIQLYRDNVESISRKFISERRIFTCEDFVLSVLIEFSESEGLPLSFLDKNLAVFGLFIIKKNLPVSVNLAKKYLKIWELKIYPTILFVKPLVFQN
jgi:hypothetical protein